MDLSVFNWHLCWTILISREKRWIFGIENSRLLQIQSEEFWELRWKSAVSPLGWAVNIACPFLSPSMNYGLSFVKMMPPVCVRLPNLPRSDYWILSHHFWHYFGRATEHRRGPFCDYPARSIYSRPTLDFSWNRRGHIDLRGRLVRLYTDGAHLRKVRRKVVDFVNPPSFEKPPGLHTSLQEAETRTVVRNRQELFVGEISELHRVLLGRYAADKMAK